jgi:hypothetical protein
MSKNLNDRIEEGYGIQKSLDNTVKSYYRQFSKLRARFKWMLEEHDYNYFITFTIDAEHYGLQEETYHKAIKKALARASSYVFNTDFGATNGRMHFHAVASFRTQLDYTTIIVYYKYGTIDFKPILKNNNDALAKYITKLQNHALKETATKIVRSRSKRNETEFECIYSTN